MKYIIMAGCFKHVRKRAAQIHKNLRLLKISFVTFRHWRGTMIADYAHGNVLKVQKLLGHKNIRNTMTCIGLINFKDDEFEVATATTVGEAKKILESVNHGLVCITTNGHDDAQFLKLRCFLDNIDTMSG